MTDTYESAPGEQQSDDEAWSWYRAGQHLEAALTLTDGRRSEAEVEAEAMEWFLTVRRRCVASVAMNDDPASVVLRLRLGQDPESLKQ